MKKRSFDKQDNPWWAEIDFEEEQDGPLTSQPFKELGRLISRKRQEQKRQAANKPPLSQSQEEPVCSDEQLFLEAMKDVVPLKGKGRDVAFHIDEHETKIRKKQEQQELHQAIMELKELIQGKRPFPVEKTPEYMDGPFYNMDKGLVRKLRRGEFAIQSYCDLHGFRADEAIQICDGFLADAIMNNKRAVAFIHGRGKSSPGKPVLKELVKDFLNRGRFRRYVLAYSSAPAWDGGPGVTYVLLRKRPVKKLKRKR